MTQTIEQLQAKVAELEKELLKTKLDLLTSYGESEELSGRIAELEKENTRLHEQVDLQIPAIAFKQLTEQLAASQAYAEQLRVALRKLIEFELLDSGASNADELCFEFREAVKGYNIPRDTSALDAYVAEQVKEAMK